MVDMFPQFKAAWKPFNQIYLTNCYVLDSYQMFTKAPIKSLVISKARKLPVPASTFATCKVSARQAYRKPGVVLQQAEDRCCLRRDAVARSRCSLQDC